MSLRESVTVRVIMVQVMVGYIPQPGEAPRLHPRRGLCQPERPSSWEPYRYCRVENKVGS